MSKKNLLLSAIFISFATILLLFYIDIYLSRSYFFFRLLLVGYQSWDELASSLYPDTELILVRSCESYVALLALTSVISSAANLIGTIFQVNNSLASYLPRKLVSWSFDVHS